MADGHAQCRMWYDGSCSQAPKWSMYVLVVDAHISKVQGGGAGVIDHTRRHGGVGTIPTNCTSVHSPVALV